MGHLESKNMFEAIVEIDETYVGGKPRKNNDKSLSGSKCEKGTNKTLVVGIVERNSKKIHAKVAMPNKNAQKLTGKQLLDILDEVTREKAVVISDEFRS